ncbi:mutS protein homolog 5-like isoform X1 [Daphnia pulicaria]|uniref:mutS protein homolog 5-like isoform X1 n=1 Tax=Daphnia pulicaria TaxID=35523 RepID=UPI001EEBFFF8|nr:mutS protein homolog 5-like isoform X1 [Daphnia pulicaria]XP_046639992.1 mutS protein homolog 5-like isoform X1 [Daphnia pulicaria]XP_046639993.1 mutS protein homolog 5-like isoform X1 [Daphnia pulicaria]
MNTPLTPVFHMNHQGLSTDQSSQPSVASCNTEIGDLTESAQPKQLILSVAWWGGKLGAAYYDIVSHELHVIPDIVENVSDTSVFRGLFFQLEPQTLIVKQNLDEKRMANIYQSLQKNVEVEGDVSLSNGTQFDAVKTVASIKFSVNERTSCHLYIVPSSYFNAEAATRRLRALRLGIAPDDMTEMERWIHLKSLFPFDYPAMLQATGALLKMLEQWRRGQDVDRLNEMNLDDKSMKIFSIRTCRVDDLLWMDQSAFLSLKIFSQESHPSAFKKGHSQSAKEGLSLFGVASKCYSTPGSMCLKELFKRPTCNVETLNERYTVIRYCMDASNVEVVRSFIGILKNITDIKVSLSNIATMRGTFNDWKKLQMTAKNLIALSDKCKILPQHIRLFYNLAESERSSKWYHVVNVIHRLINFQESKRAGRCVVNSGVDEDLDRLKREHSNMQRIYTETVNLEMENLPPFIEQGVIEFFPHVGHCLCLRSWLQKDPNRNLTTAENDVNIPGLELKFFTKENVYFKSRRCYELDETFGDFAATIVAHEMSVMLSGSKVVVEHYGALTEGIELAAYLDALLSLSVLSSEFEMVQPELVENVNPCVHIENGRHILLQLVAERFNPNSTYLGGCDEGAKRINIISGPNSSGKSIFLKQTALIVYLAQIGCFVPAQRALITPLKHIFVVSHSPETVVTSLSHFGVELSMMSMASRMATSHSLVILDEFGIGSSHVDGSAMFISCMEHWMKQNDKSPLLLVATHLHNAVEYLSRHTWVLQNTRFLSMGYFLDEEQLVFLYQLIEDMCTNSFPLSVAYASGLPNFVIKRAQEMLKAVDSVGNMTPNNLIWNDAKCSTLRRISESFFATDPWNVDDLKQFTRRNILGCWSSVPNN